MDECWTRWRSSASDRTRQNRLVAGGWRVLRFTWEDLTLRPEQVLHRIAELLEP